MIQPGTPPSWVGSWCLIFFITVITAVHVTGLISAVLDVFVDLLFLVEVLKYLVVPFGSFLGIHMR